jgi:hypothetical protein
MINVTEFVHLQSEKKPSRKNTSVDKPKKAVTKVSSNNEASEAKMEENVTVTPVHPKNGQNLKTISVLMILILQLLRVLNPSGRNYLQVSFCLMHVHLNSFLLSAAELTVRLTLIRRIVL